MAPCHCHPDLKWHSAQLWAVITSSFHLRCHHNFKLPFPGTISKGVIVNKGRVRNAKKSWAIGTELLAFSVVKSEIYKSQVYKDINSIILYFIEFKTPSSVRCTVVLHTVKKGKSLQRKEKSLQTKLWYAMDWELLHLNFRSAKMWKNVCLIINELKYFYKCT